MILDSALLLYHFENFNKWNRVFNIVELSFSIEERSRIRNEYDIFFAYRTIDPFDPRIISSFKKKKKEKKKKKRNSLIFRQCCKKEKKNSIETKYICICIYIYANRFNRKERIKRNACGLSTK